MSVLYNALRKSGDSKTAPGEPPPPPPGGFQDGAGNADHADYADGPGATSYLRRREARRRRSYLIAIGAAIMIGGGLLVDSFFASPRNPSVLQRVSSWVNANNPLDDLLQASIDGLTGLIGGANRISEEYTALDTSGPVSIPSRSMPQDMPADMPETEPEPAAPDRPLEGRVVQPAEEPSSAGTETADIPLIAMPIADSPAPEVPAESAPELSPDTVLGTDPATPAPPSPDETVQLATPAALSEEAETATPDPAPSQQADFGLSGGVMSPRRLEAELARLLPPQQPDGSTRVAMNRASAPPAAPPGADFSVSVSGPADGTDSAARLAQHRAANAALITGNLAEAQRRYRSLLDGDSGDIDALFGLATALHRSGRTGEAEPLYQAVLRAQPDNAAALANYQSLIAAQSPDRAILALQELVQAQPRNAGLQAQLARQLARNDETAAALEAAATAARLKPENPTFLYNLAVLADRAGERDLARISYAGALNAIETGVAGGLGLPAAQIRDRLAFLNRQAASPAP